MRTCINTVLKALLSLLLTTHAMGNDDSSSSSESLTPENETVILLHGLARSTRSMKRMKTALSNAGYRVYNLDYPTTEKNVKQLTEEHLAPLIARCQFSNPDKIHFVAHSLGNIVLRQYFTNHQLHNAGRLVMLGSPNQGSEVVDKLGGLAPFDWINGPAGQQLGTDTNALPATLPPPPLECGVVAGKRSINWILSCLIPGPDDGKVSIKRAQFKGMTDFIIVPVSHPFLMRDREVIKLTIHFLQNGRFPSEEAAKQ